MLSYTLTVGERQFRLRSPCNVSELCDRLIEAAQQGGAMVTLPVVGEVGISVLVSPGVCVVLETREVDPLEIFNAAVPAPWIGFDDFDF